MKRLLLLVAILSLGCTTLRRDRDRNPYDNPFYAKYLNTGSALDAQITQTLAALKANPNAASLHNQLGQLLVQKGFPKDAERELERAIDIDGRFYPAWYNLALLRAARGNTTGARVAFHRTVQLKPGHAAALFQLGLMEEQRGNRERAIEYYAKAYGINPRLLDVGINPRVLDSRLTDMALLRLYPKQHTRESMELQPAPGGYRDKTMEAPSRQPSGQEIVPPAAPVTDPARQTPPPPPAPRP